MDMIREQFLKQLWEKTEAIYDMELSDLKQNGEAEESKIVDRINIQMKILRNIYEKYTGNPPRYLVISYLRSSLLDGYPWYQLHLYDEEYYYSGRECGVWLDIPMLAERLLRIMDVVRGEFQKQTRVEEYYVDCFFMAYGEKFHQWMMEHIFEIMRRHLLTGQWEEFYAKNKMSIYIGDYRNKTSRVFGWGLETEE